MTPGLLRIFSFALTAVVASSCGAPSRAPDVVEPASAAIVWPSPPAEPRLRYVRSIAGPQDWGIRESIFRQTINALAGQAEEVTFVRPIGVAEHRGVLYVADPGAPALWILDAARSRWTKVVSVGDDALLSPVAVATTPDGSVFVADSALKKVFLLSQDGDLLRVAAKDLERPAGIAYDTRSRRLYVADAGAHDITVYGPGGSVAATWGRRGAADGEFNFPTHLAIDRSGAVLVTDALNFRIQAFDGDGRFLWKLGKPGDGAGDFAAPKGVAVDDDGHIYVVDALFDAVQIFDADRALLLAFGSQGSQPGHFWLPGGIFIASNGRIYVADSYNQRIQVFAAIGDHK